ncbi:para-aminobenzoate synthetase component 2 [Desulfobaculum xiamenense]|uniref:Para-aminobenzoate synthetase component 2 n=1 Tax=Desulfobaculum xiamenense TaxID=995050 RepID=A0A846QP19_9BACT|nr:aminodeoxychorismate/anthranilate synthase component II [Desulfobaculum xiamenense]NJB67155.1 para-aminobenzoate synthetase component 2 [Desulfobaculum xiamenense]
MDIVIIDNNDSFTRNLEHLIVVTTGARVTVRPVAELAGVDPARWDMVVISPGPGHPGEYPGYGRIIDSGVPVLGVCLGLQILNAHFGGETSRLPGCVHGKADVIDFAGRRFEVARYHSLHLSRVGQGLSVRAANADGVPMIVVHPERPLIGLQFHPESFLTADGGFFINHALAHCGLR